MHPRLFKLSPEWDDKGDYPYHYIDDSKGLFKIERFHSTISLLPSWKKPVLRVYQSGDEADIYFCTAGYFFFTARAREAFAGAFGENAEWLPATVDGIGELYILHPLRSLPLGCDAVVERNEISRNVVEIYRYRFDLSASPIPPIFFVEQPADSAAGRAGFTFHTIHMTEESIRRISSFDICGARGEEISDKK
jgi:hypothetical protein